MSAIAFSRSIGPVPINCVVREQHRSCIEVTEIPIETGARITDHAFVLPKKVSLELADEGGAATYAALMRFQESRVPFTLVTGLYVYDNMLIKDLGPERDKTFASVFKGTIELQEVIIVSTAYAATGDSNPGQPGGANSTKSGPLHSSTAGDPATADKVAGTDNRGDIGGTTVPAPENQSVGKWLFN